MNALLTQLDKLKQRKNVLIMATSNLVKAIGTLPPCYLASHLIPLSDSAFVDRADIVQYIDLPSQEAVYDILRSSVLEIMSKGVLAPLVSSFVLVLPNALSNCHGRPSQTCS